jgi:hypothetical protein
MKKILTLLLSVLFLSSFPTFATAKGITFTVLCDNNPYNLIMKNCKQDFFCLIEVVEKTILEDCLEKNMAIFLFLPELEKG